MAISICSRVSKKRSSCFTGQLGLNIKYYLVAYIQRMKDVTGILLSTSVMYQLGISCIYPDYEANYLFRLFLPLSFGYPGFSQALDQYHSASLSRSLLSIELTVRGITQTSLEPEIQNYSLNTRMSILYQALLVPDDKYNLNAFLPFQGLTVSGRNSINEKPH